jgi:hypothetical protein
MPAGEVATAFLDRARLRPALDLPIVTRHDGDKVQQFAAAQWIGHDVTMRTGPAREALLTEPQRQPRHRHDRAPGHEPGEGSAPAAVQRLADARMHAIGADQRIAADLLAVLQRQRHPARVLLQPDAAGPDVNRAGCVLRQRRHQRPVQIAAMHEPDR